MVGSFTVFKITLKLYWGGKEALEHVNDMLVNASVHEHHEKYVVLY